MMKLRVLLSTVAIFFCSSHSIAQTTLTNEAIDPRSGPREVEVKVSAAQRLNRTEVDKEKHEREIAKSYKAQLSSQAGDADVGINLEHLTREENAIRARSTAERSSSRFEPYAHYQVNQTFGLFGAYQMSRTDIDSSYGDYSLNVNRYTLGTDLSYKWGKFSLSYASEARAEYNYLSNNYPMVDREYIPAQVDFSFSRTVNENFSFTALTRYSHYNEEVYKDQSSDAPKKPTLAQVMDYLLTFKVSGVISMLSGRFNIEPSLARKAALDVNSFTGDEYVVSYQAGIGAWYRLTRMVNFGAAYDRSEGEKDHKTNGQSYNYANASESYQGFVAVKM